MVERLDRFGATGFPAPGIFAHMDDGLGVQTDADGLFAGVGECVYRPDPLEDLFGFGRFF
jgi:hypothetical protein